MSIHSLFDDDYSSVILNATIDKEAVPLLRRDTHFWVVKPRMTIRGISNASTLLSGVYIALEPGHGSPHRSFIGLETTPRITADEQGTELMLLTDNLGSIDTGSPIYYQGILVGKVLGYELGNDRKSIFVHAFVKQPFDELLQSNTRFWNVSGFSVTMDADGVSMDTESFQAFLFGGISFENPDPKNRRVKILMVLYSLFIQIKKAFMKDHTLGKVYLPYILRNRFEV